VSPLLNAALKAPLFHGGTRRIQSSLRNHFFVRDIGHPIVEKYPEAGWFEMKYLVIYEKTETGLRNQGDQIPLPSVAIGCHRG
jgi:hypothetical protein